MKEINNVTAPEETKSHNADLGIIDEIDLPQANMSIIKVIGVGGGGGNAVNHMFKQGIQDVSFVVCNTDDQALRRSPIMKKIRLGENTTHGLGAGNRPDVARLAAEESIEEIREMLSDGTKMAFITAGMGGGTGTGAAPVIAKVAREMNILTVGIVTIPFEFESKNKIISALKGVAEMSKHVDALLVINNDKLRSIYPELNLSNAFAKADDVLTSAAKGIAEIITVDGYINVDFADVSTIMRNGGVAVMNSGYAEGDLRITKAIEDALNSPLLNKNDINSAKKILLSIYSSTTNQVKMSEIDEVNAFMEQMGSDVEVIWGASFDESLGDQVKITIIATGSNMNIVPPDVLEESKTEPEEDDVTKTAESMTGGAIFGRPKGNPIEDWAGELYEGIGTNTPAQPQLTLDMIDNDPNLFHELEEEPAIKRYK